VSGDEYGKSAIGVDCGGPRPGRPRAALKQSKRTNVIKSALAVYHWFVRQALTAGKVVSRKPIGPEVTLETAELAALEGKGNLLSPAELGLLAKQLASASNPIEAAHIKERLTHGFYGI